HQPWSNGHIGLYGFSASAIAVYNSMHLPLACVDAAALMAGTNELYRDLLYPGGIPNVVPELVVGFGVGLPILARLPARHHAAKRGIFVCSARMTAFPPARRARFRIISASSTTICSAWRTAWTASRRCAC